MTEKTDQLPLTFEQILNLVLQLSKEEQEKIIQNIRKPHLENKDEIMDSELISMMAKSQGLSEVISEATNEKVFPNNLNTVISSIKKGKRAAFGAMQDSAEILGDIVEPTSNLVTWDVLE